MMELAGEVVASMHGTSCNTSQLVACDLAAGVTSPRESYFYFAAAGSFPSVELLNIRD
jgi:hypothetical protein